MAQLPQSKKGYLRGVRGMLVTILNSDGTMPVDPQKFAVKTPQEIAVEAQVVDGPAGELRGGDKLLAYAKDPDTVVAVNLTVKNARLDVAALQAIAGGTIIEVPEDGDTRIVGWQAPDIAAQQDPPVFQAEVYVGSYTQQGAVEGYVNHTFYFCRGRAGGVTYSDGAWAAQELIIFCLENPSLANTGIYKKEFVDSLPPELS